MVLHYQSGIRVVLLALAHLLSIAAGMRSKGINAQTHACMHALKCMLETMHLVFRLVESFQVSRPVSTELHLDPRAEGKQACCRPALRTECCNTHTIVIMRNKSMIRRGLNGQVKRDKKRGKTNNRTQLGIEKIKSAQLRIKMCS